MNIGCDNKIIADMSNTKFFGITIENMLSSKCHMDQHYLNYVQLAMQLD